MRGRKPVPTALRVLRGNPRKHPINDREPQPGRVVLAPPAWLAPAAAAEWTRLAPMLTRLGVLTETDVDALCAYCEAWTTWKDATAKVRALGAVLDGGEYGPTVSPWVRIADQAFKHMKTFLVEFGMTPSARARIHTAEPAKPASKWAGHL